jgi:uncharacterized surface protein with fasciclin (FAS1) repeats
LDQDLPNLRELLFFANEFIVHLRDLLLYHILPQTIALEDFFNNTDLRTADLRTANRENVRFVNILTNNTNNLTVQNRNIISTDIIATNGFTNTIDGVLLPSWVFNTLTSRVALDPDLSILNEFLNSTGIGLIVPAETFTLLAPTNAAWNANETRLSFLRSEAGRDELIDILLYHFGSPIFTVDELDVGVRIATVLFGLPVTVTSNNPIGNITFNGFVNASSPAVLLVPNILANNGVLHKIDAVLDPLDGLL